ncbi:MAG: ABC transporter ATP-binding protein [Dehalococcoidia bacterium]
MLGAAIATSGLTKDFGQLRAVDHLHLEVERGEIFGFLGPNGAGKTTTIRMLLDFIRPTAGTAEVLGGSGADPEVRRKLGYLPAELHLNRRYSGETTMSYLGSLRGGFDEPFARNLAERFRLDLDRPFGELSTGNRRKIGIVQAFMHHPELLILDEPTSGLDPLLQDEFQALVRDSAQKGATVFLCSHVLPEVEALADRVAIIRSGKLATVAHIDELRTRARHRMVMVVDGPFDPGNFQRLPGVISAEGNGQKLEVVAEGSVDAVVKEAAKLTIKRLDTPGDDLAEIFRAFYEGDE